MVSGGTRMKWPDRRLLDLIAVLADETEAALSRAQG
jgi:hypothetical protein